MPGREKSYRTFIDYSAAFDKDCQLLGLIGSALQGIYTFSYIGYRCCIAWLDRIFRLYDLWNDNGRECAHRPEFEFALRGRRAYRRGREASHGTIHIAGYYRLHCECCDDHIHKEFIKQNRNFHILLLDLYI